MSQPKIALRSSLCRLLTLTTLLLFSQGSQAAKDPAPADQNASSKGQQILGQAQCEKLPQITTDDLWKIAECYQEQANIDQAVASLREIVRKDSKNLEASFVMAWLTWEQGRAIGGRSEKKKLQEALGHLTRARKNNPTHWLLDVEIGDFYFLRLKKPELAYPEYLKARSNYDGDFSRDVEAASKGRKTSIENRIARTALILGRKGEAVEASCRALYFDPDDAEAKLRIENLSGSCARKAVKDPQKEDQ